MHPIGLVLEPCSPLHSASSSFLSNCPSPLSNLQEALRVVCRNPSWTRPRRLFLCLQNQPRWDECKRQQAQCGSVESSVSKDRLGGMHPQRHKSQQNSDTHERYKTVEAQTTKERNHQSDPYLEFCLCSTLNLRANPLLQRGPPLPPMILNFTVSSQ